MILIFNLSSSLLDTVSAFAITGMRFTCVKKKTKKEHTSDMLRNRERNFGEAQTTGFRGHLAVQFLHCDEVEGLQGVSGGSDEIQADVDSCVMAVEQGASYFQLLFQVPFKLGIDVLKNGFIAA